MAKHPPEAERVIESIEAAEIGEHLKSLAEELDAISQLTSRLNHWVSPELRRELEIDDAQIEEEAKAWELDAIQRTLTRLSSFRREYARWERLIVEYALTRAHLTQREVAGLLGVGLSTVNRWNQNPITHDE